MHNRHIDCVAHGRDKSGHQGVSISFVVHVNTVICSNSTQITNVKNVRSIPLQRKGSIVVRSHGIGGGGGGLDTASTPKRHIDVGGGGVVAGEGSWRQCFPHVCHLTVAIFKNLSQPMAEV